MNTETFVASSDWEWRHKADGNCLEDEFESRQAT